MKPAGSDISELLSSLEWWECCAYVATATVFVGVFAEALPELFNVPRTLHRQSLLKKIGLCLLLLGLAGELLTLGKTGSITGLLVARINEHTAELAAETAEANARAVRARRVAEQERFDRLQAEKKVAPRMISPEVQETLVARLKGGPKGPVLVIPRQDVDEPIAFAAQIEEVLRRAGFEIRPPLEERRRPYSWGSLGAFIIVADVSHVPAHAASIQQSFREVGVNLPIYGNVTVLPDVGTVVIGVNTPF